MWRYNYTSSYIKVDLCAHTDSKNSTFTRRVYSAYIFDSYPLPLFRRLTVGAAIEKNFLFFFVTSFLFGFVLDFIQNICRFNSLQVFSRYSPSVSFYIHHVWISRFQTLNFDSFLLVEFYLHQFRLVSALLILCFNSSTLYLFNFSACYKQTYMLI